MHSAFTPRLFALLSALFAGHSLAAEETLRFEEGVARNPATSAEMYREQHWVRSQAGRPVERLVLYRCPDGTAFARKRVDYRNSAISPAFAFEDRRSGHREGLRRATTPTLFFQAPGAIAERLARIDKAGFVADAGFDEFIRRHWSGLTAGRAMPLEFALPSRLRSLPFSVQRQGSVIDTNAYLVQPPAAVRWTLPRTTAEGVRSSVIEIEVLHDVQCGNGILPRLRLAQLFQRDTIQKPQHALHGFYIGRTFPGRIDTVREGIEINCA